MALKQVSVYGASGRQGLSVVKALLEDYRVNALTRSPEKLKDLSHPNLTVLKVDLEDPATLTAAFKGSWAVFANTFSDHSKPEGAEVELGKSIADAVVEAGVEWFVWSGEPTGVESRAWREKAATMTYARELAQKTGLKNVFVQVGAYMSNFYFEPVLNSESGYYELSFPIIDETTYFPMVYTIADLGPVVKAILSNPDEWLDDEIPLVGDALRLPDIAAIYGKVHDVPARALFVDSHPLLAIPRFKDALDSFKTVGYYPKYFGREEELPVKARKLNPTMTSWEKWLREVGRFDPGPKFTKA